MDNLQKTIDRDVNDWIALENPIYKDKTLTERVTETEKESAYSKPGNIRILSPVVTIQLILVLLVLIVSYVSKTFFFSKFSSWKQAYDSEISASMFFDGEFKSLDYSDFFIKNNDQV